MLGRGGWDDSEGAGDKRNVFSVLKLQSDAGMGQRVILEVEILDCLDRFRVMTDEIHLVFGDDIHFSVAGDRDDDGCRVFVFDKKRSRPF